MRRQTQTVHPFCSFIYSFPTQQDCVFPVVGRGKMYRRAVDFKTFHGFVVIFISFTFLSWKRYVDIYDDCDTIENLYPVPRSLFLCLMAGDWCMYDSDTEFPIRMICYKQTASNSTACNLHEQEYLSFTKE